MRHLPRSLLAALILSPALVQFADACKVWEYVDVEYTEGTMPMKRQVKRCVDPTATGKIDNNGESQNGFSKPPIATGNNNTPSMAGDMGKGMMRAVNEMVVNPDVIDPTAGLTGPALIKSFTDHGVPQRDANEFAGAYATALAKGGPNGVSYNAVLPAIEEALARNTGNPAVAKEIVDHFRVSASKTPGFGDKPFTPKAMAEWSNLFHQDTKIDELYDRGVANGGMTKEEKRQWLALVDKRNNYMASPLGTSYGAIHMNYMQDDPISKTLPPDTRINHDDGIIKVDPKSGYGLRAETQLALGNPQAALADAGKAVALDPKNAGALLTQGAAQERLGQFSAAADSARKALELNPSDTGALALLKSVEGRSSPASAGSAGALGTGAGSAGAGNAGFATGGFGSAGDRGVPGMTNAATISSNQKLEEARRAVALGDSQAALALAQRALELNPNNAAAHAFMSGVYAYTGDYRRAIASAEAGLALNPRDAALLNSKAFAENRSKQYRSALASSNGAIESDARNPYSYANRAYAYGGLGDKDSMLSDINRAAAIDPRFQKAAADAAALQLPSNADVLFLFPGENPAPVAAAAVAPRGKSFGVVVGAGILGGLLLALGLLSTVLAPLKDSVVSAFTKATRRGPSVHALEDAEAPAVLASVTAAAAGLVRGQYEIKRQIGQGGMGMVYEGTDRSLGRRVAIKKMREELRVNARERDRFIIEAKTVASLHHPNIVDIYAIAEEGEDVYLVFEYVDGKTIHDLVQTKGRLSPADTLRVTRSMGEALSYAHAHGVIHRDMKPSNVMLTSGGQVKVMDFGIARMAKDAMTRYSLTNNVVGTPPYMAPEQEQGIVRKESDVYSLAVCAYEMLTGKLPFIGMGAGMLMNKINMSYIPPARAIAGLPDSLDEVFLKAFQADPDQRYRTPVEFTAALETAMGGAHAPSQA